MKKFLKEFKDFAIKGNFLDMAVAVVLGGAFSKVVNAVIEIFLRPAGHRRRQRSLRGRTGRGAGRAERTVCRRAWK